MPQYGQARRHKQNRSCAHRVGAMRRGGGRQARAEKVPLPGEVVVNDGVGRRDKHVQLDAQHASHDVAVPSRLLATPPPPAEALRATTLIARLTCSAHCGKCWCEQDGGRGVTSTARQKAGTRKTRGDDVKRTASAVAPWSGVPDGRASSRQCTRFLNHERYEAEPVRAKKAIAKLWASLVMRVRQKLTCLLAATVPAASYAWQSDPYPHLARCATC